MRRAFAVACLCTSLIASANADRPAVAFSAGTAGGFPPGSSGTVGFHFSSVQAVVVTALGVYDVDGDGLAESHQVGLWDGNGDLVALANVSAGTKPELRAGFRYVSLSRPVLLSAGTSYALGAFFSSADQAISRATDFSFDPSLRYIGAAAIGGMTLARPRLSGAIDNPGIFGPALLVADNAETVPGLQGNDACRSGPARLARTSHSATLLNNGKVLIAGGEVRVYDATGTYNTVDGIAELVDPRSGDFVRLSANMALPRQGHTATLLENGKVLIVGGYSLLVSGGCTSATELFEPDSGSFVALGDMAVARWGHTATVLNDGTILIAGGRDASAAQDSAELFHPATNEFTVLPARMNRRRYQHTATRLPDGRVLIAGGNSWNGTGDNAYTNSAEIYDPVERSFTMVSAMNVARADGTATLLNSGEVLFAGGWGEATSATAEIYNPVSATFALLAARLNSGRALHSSTLLSNGNVLIAGGSGTGGGTLNSAEIFDAQSREFTPAGSMFAGRERRSAIRLPAGKIFFDGPGNGDEVFDPTTGTFALLFRSAICSISMENGFLTLHGETIASRTVEIQSASELGGEFVPLQTLPRTVDSKFIWGQSTASSPSRRFYRAVAR